MRGLVFRSAEEACGNEDLQELRDWANQRLWFYKFQLPDGTAPPCSSSPAIQVFHEARRVAMLDVLAAEFGDLRSDIDCIDLSSHEGYFSFALAPFVRSVRGVDVNPDSVNSALRMAALLGLKNVSFAEADIRQLDQEHIAEADFVLLFGLIYHAEDPVRMLRIASGLTKRVLLIETQLSGFEISGEIEWGAYFWQRSIEGHFLVVEDHAGREGGNTGIALVPSPNSLRFLLSKLGFSRIEFVHADFGDAEQLVRRRRAIVAAFR